MKFYIKFVSFLGLTSLVLSLAGCAQHKSAPSTPTQKQQRASIENKLNAANVMVIKVANSVKIVFQTSNVFYPGTADIMPNAATSIDLAAQYINTFTTGTVKIFAYCDNYVITKSLAKHKQWLTNKQASAILNALWDRKIKASIAYASGKSFHSAVAWNGTEAGRNMNKRVEISFITYPTKNKYN